MIYKKDGKILVKDGKLCSTCCTEYGEDCDTCEPDLWVDGQTPKTVTVTFANINQCGGCGAPPDGEYVLTQLAACQWVYDGDDYWISWLIAPGVTYLVAYDQNPGGTEQYFEDNPQAPCLTSFANDAPNIDWCGTEVADPLYWAGYGGTAEVTW